MREIYYNSDITPKAANEIKLLALYYDKINIVNDAVYTPKFETTNGKFEFAGVEDIQFIPRKFREDYKLLIDEGLMSITKRDEKADDPYEKQFASKISEIVNASNSYIYPLHPEKPDTKIITEEVFDIMTNIFDFEPGKPVGVNLVWWYYAFKLKWFVKLLMEGQTCITSSNNLNHLFTALIKESEQLNFKSGVEGYSKSLAFDALKIGLPNPDNLSLEDILELKLKLKDELGLFYQTINAIEVKNKQLFDTNINHKEYEAVFYSEIQKPLRELETKMKNLKSKTFRLFVDKMKDYKTYVPLVGTVVASIPIQYAILTSLSMTAGQSYLEFKEEKREIKNNGLYFLLKFKK
ncbi:hypothetical protein [Mucilaginibacter sp.]|jgi:hypothetical protein|uniref:hypothetical protein n=1 Tax=Mucilaginibacter sp. TaxID=1882438 RepID=UPI00356657A9